jgi:hypothetical protein
MQIAPRLAIGVGGQKTVPRQPVVILAMHDLPKMFILTPVYPIQLGYVDIILVGLRQLCQGARLKGSKFFPWLRGSGQPLVIGTNSQPVIQITIGKRIGEGGA